MNLRIQDCFPSVTKDEALAYGRKHGIYMPEELATHLSVNNGGGWHSSVCVNRGAKNLAGVGNLLGIDDRYQWSNIRFTWDWVLDRDPKMTPIASDGCGHPFVIWTKRPGRVFYFDKDKNRPTTEIAHSIRHFLESISQFRYPPSLKAK
jgi:hypothetical protein